mgnify:CR=1 FL=1
MGSSCREIQAYYDKHLSQKVRDLKHGNPRVEQAWQTVQRWAPKSPLRILEIGCGIGLICHRMGELWPDAHVTGLDISPKSIETARSLFVSPRLSFIQGKLEEGVVSGFFDLIVMMDVYEHIKIEDRNEVHEFLKKILDLEGRVILSFPTPRHQKWLRNNYPDQIQPVDEDIEVECITSMAKNTDTRLVMYQEVDVWHRGDYAHAVLAKTQNWEKHAPKCRIQSISDQLTHEVNKGNSNIQSKRNINLVFVQQGFPKLSETFILDQITGLMDRGLGLENWAIFNPKEKQVHPEVLKYDLVKTTRYISLPDGERPGRTGEWLERFFVLNGLTPADLQKVSAFHVHFGPTFNALRHLFSWVDARIVVSFHGYDASKVIRQCGPGWYDALFERADLITAPSHHVARSLMEHGCPSHKLIIHRYGVKLSSFRPVVREAPPFPQIILTVGRLVEKKGIEHSLRAFAKLPREMDVQYRIVGDGPLLHRLTALARELRIEERVRFLGALDRNAVIKEMEQADLFVLTSVTSSDGDQEGLPVSLIEAHALGLPVVSTYHSGIPELVQHGKTGFLAPEGDVERIAEYMGSLISDADLRSRLSRNARRKVQDEFDIEKLNDALAGYLACSTSSLKGPDQTCGPKDCDAHLERRLNDLPIVVGQGTGAGVGSDAQSQTFRHAGGTSPLVTVCIPAFNRAHFIRHCLMSALDQDYSPLEVLLVDDGSADETREIVTSFGEDKVRYIMKEHSGAADTRNRCVREARGDYVLWLDSDDVLLPGTVSAYVDALRQYPDVDVLYGDLEVTDEDLKPMGVMRIGDYYRRTGRLISRMAQGCPIPNPGTLVRKECYRRIGLFDIAFVRAHDYEWWSRAASSLVFKHVGRCVAKYRTHDRGQLTGVSRKIDTSYEGRILFNMLTRYSLKELYPDAAWDRLTETEAEALAWIHAAGGLLGWGNLAGAIFCLENSCRLSPRASTLSLLEKTRAFEKKSRSLPVLERQGIPGLSAMKDRIAQCLVDKQWYAGASLCRKGLEVFPEDEQMLKALSICLQLGGREQSAFTC